jgi:hypothetical protein
MLVNYASMTASRHLKNALSCPDKRRITGLLPHCRKRLSSCAQRRIP